MVVKQLGRGVYTKNPFFNPLSPEKTIKTYINHAINPKHSKITPKNKNKSNPKNQNQTKYASPAMCRDKNYIH
jgi:hypothetical protein